MICELKRMYCYEEKDRGTDVAWKTVTLFFRVAAVLQIFLSTDVVSNILM